MAGPANAAAVCGTIDNSRPFFTQDDCEAQSNPIVFDGGTLKPTMAFTFNENVTVDAPGGTIDATNGFLVFTGPISGAGALTFIGVGGTQLSGVFSAAGGATATGNGASLEISNLFENAPLNISAGALVAIDKAASVTGSAITMTGGSISELGTLSNDTAAVTGGAIFVGGSGVISNSTLSVSGSGRINIVAMGAQVSNSTLNVETGGMADIQGTLTTDMIHVTGGTVDASGTINGGTITVDSGSFTNDLNGLIENSAIAFDGGAFASVSSILDSSITLAAGTNLVAVTSLGNVTIGGTISGPGSITLGGGQITTFASNVTDSGVVITSGTVNITGSIGGSPVSISGGATTAASGSSVEGSTVSLTEGILTAAGGSTLGNDGIAVGDHATLQLMGALSGGSVSSTGTVFIDNGATVENATLADNGGTFSNAGAISNSSLAIAGELDDAGRIIASTATLGAGGDLAVKAGGEVGSTAITQDGGLIEVSGRIDTHSTVESLGGMLTVESGGTIDSSVVDALGGQMLVSTGATVTGSTLTAGNGGKIEVDGSTATSASSVNNGGAVLGTGTLGNTTINTGGTLSPGTAAVPTATLAVNGNLTLNPGAAYLYDVTNAGHDAVAVTGTATLGGTLLASASGSFTVGQSFLVLSSGMRVGTFAALDTSGFGGAVRPTLDYEGNSVFLLLEPNAISPSLPSNASRNERAVAGAIDFAIANDDAIAFGPLFGLSGNDLRVALDGLSGEGDAAGAEGAFAVGNAFLAVMLDPSLDARGGAAGAGGPALAFAPGYHAGPQAALSLTAGPRRLAPGDDPLTAPASNLGDVSGSFAAGSLGVWFAGYGEHDSLQGDDAAGSHQLGSTESGVAGGIDVRPTETSVVGAAFGYGHVGWSIADLTSTGKSNVVQGGVYGSMLLGDAYLSAAFDYASYDVSTARTLILGGTSRYAAKFDATGYGGRFEAGDRMWREGDATLSPYIAVNAQAYDTPAYTETTLAGSTAFAQSVAADSKSDVSSEIGAKIDATPADGAIAINAALAWAHDYTPGLASTVAFASFPGTNFVVRAAPMPRDAALVSLGLGTLWHGLDIGAKFTGKFAGDATSIGGSAAISYRW